MKNFLLAVTLSIIVFCSCDGGKNSRKHGGNNTDSGNNTTTSDLTLKKPAVNVYIENSASMDGYVEGVTEFEQTVYNYLSDIKISDFTDTLNLFYINSQIIPYGSDIADFIEKLEPTTFKARGGNRGTTDISNVFKTILAETKENTVAILITDGIFSPGKGRNAQQYLVNQQIGIKNTMAEYLRNFPNTAVVVYQLSSNFKGRYFNREDIPTNINAQRPYYIWVVGDVANIFLLKALIPEKNFKGSGIHHSFTLLPSFEKEIEDYAILNSPKLGSFDRDKNTPKTSIYNIKKASSGVQKGNFMFTIGMDLSLFSVLLGDEYLMNTESYAQMIEKQSNNDYFIEMERSTNPNTKHTHNMKLTTENVATGELEIVLRSQMPPWVYEINDDEGLDIFKNDAMNKTFGIKYLVEGVYEAYQMRGNAIYTTMKFNLKK
jgi:hypothetical protein